MIPRRRPQRMTLADCEGIAAHVIERGQFGAAPNPWEIVDRLRLAVRYGDEGCRPQVENARGRWRIVLDPAERAESQALTLLHEAAHVLNRSNGIEDTEQHAWWTALAMMFPRTDFRIRRRSCGWAVDLLLPHYPWSSHEACARRIVMMEQAVLWVWDAEGPRRRRYPVVSPGWRWPHRRPTPVEQEAMSAALEGGCAVEPVGGVRAWAVIDPPWTRILCLSDGEVLAGLAA